MPDDDDDDLELELEPPDADVIAAEKRHAESAVEASQMAIDIDAIYRDTGRDRGREIIEDWTRGFKFQFQVKHLLIATAVLAIILTLYRLELLGTAVVLIVMVSVISLYLYLQWQEKKQQDEATRRWKEAYERRRQYLERQLRAGGTAGDETPQAAAVESTLNEELEKAKPKTPFRFHFSMFELMTAMTVAAVIFGLIHVLGGTSNTATLLGFVALFGLVIHALGFEPPAIIALGWWFILVLYVLLSIVAAVWSGMA